MAANSVRFRRVVVAGVLVVAAAALLLTTPGSSRARARVHTGADAASSTLDDAVHLNQIQVIGTHNSYHWEAPAAEELIRGAVAPGDERTLEYDHPALPVQFASQRVRQIELDVHLDSHGGLFAHPFLRTALVEGALPYQSEMAAPGIKVFHIHDVDYLSRCPTFLDCLHQLANWSNANPSHVPIMVLVELVDTPITTLPAALQVTEEPWTSATVREIDREIRAVFSPDQLFTPDDLRGSYPSVEAAARAGNWPTLGASRGKVLFTMDNHGTYRDAYLQAYPDARGAVLFADGDAPVPGGAAEPWRAFVEMNDPTGANTAVIADLVRQGYVVRSRADADTGEARSGATAMRDAALASGAQWVSTDYPVEGLAARFATSYFAALPTGTTARCDPVNAPPACAGNDALLDPVAVAPPPPPTTTTTIAPASTPTTSPGSGERRSVAPPFVG